MSTCHKQSPCRLSGESCPEASPRELPVRSVLQGSKYKSVVDLAYLLNVAKELVLPAHLKGLVLHEVGIHKEVTPF